MAVRKTLMFQKVRYLRAVFDEVAEREGLCPAGAKRPSKYKFIRVFGRSLIPWVYTEVLHHGNDQDAHPDSASNAVAGMKWEALAAAFDEDVDEEELDLCAREILAQEISVAPSEAEVKKFKPLLLDARQRAYRDIVRAAKGDYSANEELG